jgi:hypothetical protein
VVVAMVQQLVETAQREKLWEERVQPNKNIDSEKTRMCTMPQLQRMEQVVNKRHSPVEMEEHWVVE